MPVYGRPNYGKTGKGSFSVKEISASDPCMGFYSGIYNPGRQGPKA